MEQTITTYIEQQTNSKHIELTKLKTHHYTKPWILFHTRFLIFILSLKLGFPLQTENSI